jgi:hypothetical protein
VDDDLAAEVDDEPDGWGNRIDVWIAGLPVVAE